MVCKKILSRYELPERIIGDKTTNFVNAEFKSIESVKIAILLQHSDAEEKYTKQAWIPSYSEIFCEEFGMTISIKES